ncbi:diaminobutyrate--2-oxoglutarate transaminase [Enterococcus sp. HY326]|uniref:diaminobutyrate--2-oxoglutarate transaminase n=1 Tax=Enterococcus sp. HY326 TaxID=2971265 RepID=UPI00223F76B9|nr:diaminobutyrate--2-oxoglutarate transaminase [Enterococcus sp. HY326]
MVIQSLEANVVSYAKSFPFQFDFAKNATLMTTDQREFIDFFAGAGALNFGHNNPYIKKQILAYLNEDRIIHGLDLDTTARAEFFVTFHKEILQPKNLDYKIMSCGPTGTNAVEAALKLARKATGRQNILAFSGGFHGMSLGALALTSDQASRKGAGVPLNFVTHLPFVESAVDTQLALKNLRELLADDHSGMELPAAIMLETVQAEGGVHVADSEWLRGLRSICDEFGILLLIDEIQTGVGRTGSFFSFERAGIVPDMVMLSKSISGFGLPLSLVLFKPELDVFNPGEHNGTFRGNQLGFVGATAALKFYVAQELSLLTETKGKLVEEFLTQQLIPLHPQLQMRGLGLLWGIDFSEIDSQLAKKVQQLCVSQGLIIELAGRKDAVLKLLPPLTIPKAQLRAGLKIIFSAVATVLQEERHICKVS